MQTPPPERDFSIGMICLDTRFSKPPGHIRHPATFDFPVRYEIIPGSSVDEIINNPAPEWIAPFVEAAKKLEREGCGAIGASCGFFALYQQTLAGAVNIPVLTSSLMQIPFIRQFMTPGRKIGVLTASRRRLTAAHFRAVGAENAPMVIRGMEDYPEFYDVILTGKREDFDARKLKDEILHSVKALLHSDSHLGALLLECTDISPYVAAIRGITDLPVFDAVTLLKTAHSALCNDI